MPLPSRRARAIAWRTRSANSARLASPVTGSWNAWWVSCSSKALRSLTSRALSTMPPTCSSSMRFVYEDLELARAAVAVHAACTRTPAGRPGAGDGGLDEHLQQPRAVALGRRGARSGVPTTSSGVVAEHPLDRRALVVDACRRGRATVMRSLAVPDQRAEARLAAPAVHLLAQRGAVERERDLGGERPQRRAGACAAFVDRGDRASAGARASAPGLNARACRARRGDAALGLLGRAGRRGASPSRGVPSDRREARVGRRRRRDGRAAIGVVGATRARARRRRRASAAASCGDAVDLVARRGATSAAPASLSMRSRSSERSCWRTSPAMRTTTRPNSAIDAARTTAVVEVAAG